MSFEVVSVLSWHETYIWLYCMAKLVSVCFCGRMCVCVGELNWSFSSGSVAYQESVSDDVCENTFTHTGVHTHRLRATVKLCHSELHC